ncbi:hypothetical protein GCM10007094_23900 [Pseudovibrio japonicus]|uniref:Uncharacterized protein n=1 Tax=Pseudovibrio japonicus TaxID=366534 RepID=A0ABQ3EGL7_9HYPH|nr:baseplate assembly protein [Pseudovibrio japonicus]GHB34073.1 hypothetical protein GCM10007094_23900 [Pseudovibrio japonicus]
MISVGINMTNGKLLTGWEHTVQSVGFILNTELKSRVNHRYIGSNIPTVIDEPANAETIMDLMMASAEALEARLYKGRWLGEPRYFVNKLNVESLVPGRAVMPLSGYYFPKGHLGDFSQYEERGMTAYVAGHDAPTLSEN